MVYTSAPLRVAAKRTPRNRPTKPSKHTETELKRPIARQIETCTPYLKNSGGTRRLSVLARAVSANILSLTAIAILQSLFSLCRKSRLFWLVRLLSYFGDYFPVDYVCLHLRRVLSRFANIRLICLFGFRSVAQIKAQVNGKNFRLKVE